MANKAASGPSPIVQNMTDKDFAKIRRELKDAQDAADDASTVVASQYKKLKKSGHHIDALKAINKLVALDNPAKVQAFLSNFDKYRAVAKLDAQQTLFEEDKTKPQKDAEAAAAAKKNGKAPKNGAKPGKETKGRKNTVVPLGRVARGGKTPQVPAPREVKPAAGGRKALFAESDDDNERTVN